MLVVLLDDVGYADFGCYGSAIATPTIDRLADDGLRYTGFHTTAMCSSLPGACHAPHQAPRELIDRYTTTFEHGWDVECEQRLARQIELGVGARREPNCPHATSV